MIVPLRGTRFAEYIFPEAQHEVFNEINQDEVLSVVIAFVRRALAADQTAGLRAKVLRECTARWAPA